MYQLSKYFNSEYGEQICNYSESNFKFVSTCTRLTTIYRHSVIHSLIFIRFFNLTLCFRFFFVRYYTVEGTQKKFIVN